MEIVKTTYIIMVYTNYKSTKCVAFSFYTGLAICQQIWVLSRPVANTSKYQSILVNTGQYGNSKDHLHTCNNGLYQLRVHKMFCFLFKWFSFYTGLAICQSRPVANTSKYRSILVNTGQYGNSKDHIHNNGLYQLQVHKMCCFLFKCFSFYTGLAICQQIWVLTRPVANTSKYWSILVNTGQYGNSKDHLHNNGPYQLQVHKMCCFLFKWFSFYTWLAICQQIWVLSRPVANTSKYRSWNTGKYGTIWK